MSLPCSSFLQFQFCLSTDFNDNNRSQPNKRRLLYNTSLWSVIMIFTIITPATVGGQFFGAIPALDCRRVHPRYCCTSRVRYACADMCAQHPCNTLPTLHSIELPPQMRLSNTGEWTPQKILTGASNRRPPRPTQIPQAPAGLVLPPEDTDLAKETLHSINGDDVKEIPVLPYIDSSATSLAKNFGGLPVNSGNVKASNSQPFPTLIPRNSNNIPEPEIRPTTAALTIRLSRVKTSGGAVNGESRIAGHEYQISQTRRNKLAGILEPPESSLMSFQKDDTDPFPDETSNKYEELENLHYEKHKEDSNKLVTTVSPTLENIPPLPTHPETTWVPLKFNIRPSALNTSKASRTTQTDHNMRLTTKSALFSIEKELIAIEDRSPNDHPSQTTISPLKGIEAALLENQELGTDPMFTHNSKPLSFSSSFKRRDDLPFPREERPEENSENTEKMLKKLNQQVVENSNSTSATENSIGLFGSKINVIVDHLITQKTIDAITSLTGRRLRRPKGPNNTVSTTLAPLKPMTAVSPMTTVDNSQNKCGVAPHFQPCVERSEANQRLLECCRRKLMPPGCLDLCRYDVTQQKIKNAFDAAKCGILNVAPYLECASQNEDNLDCCRHQNIAQKSGPQCEVFCNPKKGFGSLGLQHLACQNVISDLLKCHHSGLRPH